MQILYVLFNICILLLLGTPKLIWLVTLSKINSEIITLFIQFSVIIDIFYC
jgi:hypothetical protein